MARKFLTYTALLAILSTSCLPKPKNGAKTASTNQTVQTLTQVQAQLLQARQAGKYWNYPLYLGPMYTSQYILLRNLLNFSFDENKKYYPKELPPSSLNQNDFKKYLLQTQMPNGSWPLIYDRNTNKGDLNATVMHYAALKSMGAQIDDPMLQKAKSFILTNGGIKKTSLFSKIVLNLFNNSSWNDIPNIPYIVFNDDFVLNYKDFGRWIGPHLFPIAYLKKAKAQTQLGPLFDLRELWLEIPEDIKNISPGKYYASAVAPEKSDKKIILKILARQKPNGSFGGYTTATLFSLVALRQYQNFYHDLDIEINAAFAKGFAFVDMLYFQTGESSSLGVTCDGRYWDTALIGQGLLESGTSPAALADTSKYLFDIQDKESGGFGFGLDFEDDMDTDDTAEILLYFNKAGIKNEKTEKAITWLFSMQDRDGGWGAFDKNNNGNIILKIATRSFLDSADMFDESSPDVTGHILEALGTYGYTIDNSPVVKKAVHYLSATMDKNFAAWTGRWGSNYIYGTSASLIGLMKVGVPRYSDYIEKPVQWLMSCQNKTDGGFGESFDSYALPEKACRGVSTPSQTAWALMALIATGDGHSSAAKNAAQYLMNTYKERGQKWVDYETVVGTGHPKIVPMQYPSYAWAFPLMALARYQKISSEIHP